MFLIVHKNYRDFNFRLGADGDSSYQNEEAFKRELLDSKLKLEVPDNYGTVYYTVGTEE